MSEAIASPETRTKEAEQLADRYLALWNEPDAERRRRHDRRALDRGRVADPPAAAGDARDRRERRASAWRPRSRRGDTPSSRRGRQRPTSSGSGPPDSASGGATTSIGCGDVVKFHWEAVSPDGEVTAVGLVFLVLGADGRIRRDYVFIES